MIGALLGGIWGRIAGIAAAIGGLLLIGWRIFAGIKQSGRTEQRLEDANAGLQGRLEAKEKVDAVRDDVDRLGVDERLSRLRENERRARGDGA